MIPHARAEDGVWDVELKQVTRQFGKSLAVNNIDLQIQRGEFFGILGPSGSGKTTTLRMIAGLVIPTSGDILIRGRVVNDVPVHHRDLGMVFQNYALFPHLTVFENVAFGLRMRRVTSTAISNKVAQALKLVRLEEMEERYPSQLSGGQQQRVALARCFAIEPAVLLLDEPLGALDKKLREEMQVELRYLHNKLGMTTVFVTHDQEEALSLSDRIAIMNHGGIEQVGTPVEIYEHPRTRFVSQFIGACNFFEGRILAIQDQRAMVATRNGMRILANVGGEEHHSGDAVIIAVRPERVQLHTTCPASGSTAYEAEIRHIVYLGSLVHYHVRTPQGDELRVHEQNTRPTSDRPQAGQRMWFTFESDAPRVVQD